MRFLYRIFLTILIAVGMQSFQVSAETRYSPFTIRVDASNNDPSRALNIHFGVPTNCVLYFERLHFFDASGEEFQPSHIATPVMELDKVSGKQKKVYDQDFVAEVQLSNAANTKFTVKFQGCTNEECFFPEAHVFIKGTNGVFSEVVEPEETESTSATPADWAREMHDFKVVAQQSGFVPSKSFLVFLDHALSGEADTNDPAYRFAKAGLSLTLLLIIVGGLLLNLTPCVLPMIPINLSIIGAGTAAKSRMVGFINGGIYGAGMALAYGFLGIAVVVTGAKFGSLNSSVWFNIVISLVFVVLALGMFDLIHIDLSRFSTIGPRGNHVDKGVLIRHALIFIMGGMAALLAGACVAPVVISVMLLAANIYAKGNVAGLLLPFLLGVGMALPWPIAGAGLSFLPKPGKWMNRIKHSFGVLILLFGFYYGYLAYEAHTASQAVTSLAGAPMQGGTVIGSPNEQLAEALRRARLENRPVLVDFRASWCKNCLAMDETVFRKPEVKGKIENFILVRYDAERPSAQPAKEVLDHFGVIGLPTYIVLNSVKQVQSEK